MSDSRPPSDPTTPNNIINFPEPDTPALTVADLDFLRPFARAAAQRSRTLPLYLQIGRGCALGFEAQLAAFVLKDEESQRQVKRLWSENGISGRIRRLAEEPTEIGRLHTQLIGLLEAAPSTVGEDTPVLDNVIRGLWHFIPVSTLTLAAANDDRRDSFTARKPEWGLELVLTPLPSGNTRLDISQHADLATNPPMIMVTVSDTAYAVPLRKRGEQLLGVLTLPSDVVWDDEGLIIATSADLGEDAPAVIARTVAEASTADRNLWRRLLRGLPDEHAVATAIREGLK